MVTDLGAVPSLISPGQDSGYSSDDFVLRKIAILNTDSLLNLSIFSRVGTGTNILHIEDNESLLKFKQC